MREDLKHLTMSHAESALNLAKKMMPKQEMCNKIQKYYTEMVNEKESPSEIVKTMFASVLDGIMYGNWP